MTSFRALRLRAGRHDLTVQVFGDTARLELHSPADEGWPPEATGWGEPGPTARPVAVEVSARGLVAALRAAWADEHGGSCFEPWRDRPVDGPLDPHPMFRAGDGIRRPWDEPGPDDLGDGDPHGFHDPRVVPFPMPPPPPRPARGGLPWECDEEVTIRQRWLAAAPDADREVLLREIAEVVERGVGGVAVRLRQVGCDPLRPGCVLPRPWETSTPDGGEPGTPPHAPGVDDGDVLDAR